jgi:dolichol kinase
MVFLRNLPEDDVKSRLAAARGEAVRKGLHGLGCVWAIWGLYWPWLPVVGLAFFSVIYLIYEALRLRGRGLYLVEQLGRIIRRRKEHEKPAFGPPALAIAIIICFLVFDPQVACAAVLAACGCDCAAGIAGSLWGRHALPFLSGKTIEGSLAGLVVGFLACAPVAGVAKGLLTSMAATIAEALPLQEIDNIIVPVAAACVLALVST